MSFPIPDIPPAPLRYGTGRSPSAFYRVPSAAPVGQVSIAAYFPTAPITAGAGFTAPRVVAAIAFVGARAPFKLGSLTHLPNPYTFRMSIVNADR